MFPIAYISRMLTASLCHACYLFIISYTSNKRRSAREGYKPSWTVYTYKTGDSMFQTGMDFFLHLHIICESQHRYRRPHGGRQDGGQPSSPARSQPGRRHSRQSASHWNISPTTASLASQQRRQRPRRRREPVPPPSPSDGPPNHHSDLRPETQDRDHEPDLRFDVADDASEEHAFSRGSPSLDSVDSAERRRVDQAREQIGDWQETAAQERAGIRHNGSGNDGIQGSDTQNERSFEPADDYCERCFQHHSRYHDPTEGYCARCQHHHKKYHKQDGERGTTTSGYGSRRSLPAERQHRRGYGRERRGGEEHQNTHSNRGAPRSTFSAFIGKYILSLKPAFDFKHGRSEMRSRHPRVREYSSLGGGGTLSRLGINVLTPFGGYEPSETGDDHRSSERVGRGGPRSGATRHRTRRAKEAGRRESPDSTSGSNSGVEPESRIPERRWITERHPEHMMTGGRSSATSQAACSDAAEVNPSFAQSAQGLHSDDHISNPHRSRNSNHGSSEARSRGSDLTRGNLQRLRREQEGGRPSPPMRHSSAALSGLYSSTYREERQQAATRRRHERANASPNGQSAENRGRTRLISPSRQIEWPAERRVVERESGSLARGSPLAGQSEGRTPRVATSRESGRATVTARHSRQPGVAQSISEFFHQGGRRSDRRTRSEAGAGWVDPIRSDASVAEVQRNWPEVNVSHEQRERFFAGRHDA